MIHYISVRKHGIRFGRHKMIDYLKKHKDKVYHFFCSYTAKEPCKSCPIRQKAMRAYKLIEAENE